MQNQCYINDKDQVILKMGSKLLEINKESEKQNTSDGEQIK